MKCTSIIAVAVLACLPSLAQAGTGYVPRAADILAGPGAYPTVSAIPSGSVVNIVGCVSSYRWCDVTYRSERGWVAGDQLEIPFQGRRVSVVDYGNQLQVPITAFEFNPYWESNYRNREFFRERERWARIREEERERMAEERARDETVRQEIRRELREEDTVTTR